MAKSLACAIIWRAFEDLERLHSGRECVRIGRHTIKDAVETAVAFLTHTDDEWGEWRQFWADQAGWDAERLRRRALVIIEERQHDNQSSMGTGR